MPVGSGLDRIPRLILIVASLLLVLAGCREIFTGKREARGVWFSRFEYAGRDPEKARHRITEVLEKARRARLNMVFFQVRGHGDAYYRSSLEPWAEALSGRLGQDPGWDPLAYAVGEAHRLGLELHAWVNTFTAWRGKRPPPETVPPSPYLAHPEWLVCDGEGRPMPLTEGYVYFSPGVPEARRHIIEVAREIVANYDVDGIHFDYLRYPEEAPRRGFSRDPESVARYESPEANPFRLDWEDWQREQLNHFVFEAYNCLTAAKPLVKVSAAVVGKYAGPGWNGYGSVYQDARRWLELGKIDFVAPMVYWERGHKTHPFGPLVSEWADRVAYDRLVFPGISVALAKSAGWEEISGQIAESRKRGLPGVVFFAAGSLDASWETLGATEFPYWANVPRMPWKDSVPPKAPALKSAEPVPGGIRLTWEPLPEDDPALTFNIYRSKTPDIDPADVKGLLHVTGRNATSFVDTTAGNKKWYYAVAGLDRAGNESDLSNVVSSPPGKN